MIFTNIKHDSLSGKSSL